MLDRALSESYRRRSPLSHELPGVCETSVKLDSKPGRAMPTTDYNQGLCPCLMSSFLKLVLASPGDSPCYRKILGKSEGPHHPHGHKAVHGMQRPQTSVAWQPGAELSQEVRVLQCQSLNCSIKGGASRGQVQQIRRPLLKGTLQGHAI